jgi:hypothetical protein
MFLEGTEVSLVSTTSSSSHCLMGSGDEAVEERIGRLTCLKLHRAIFSLPLTSLRLLVQGQSYFCILFEIHLCISMRFVARRLRGGNVALGVLKNLLLFYAVVITVS